MVEKMNVGDVLRLFGRTYIIEEVTPESDWFWRVDVTDVEGNKGHLILPSDEITY